MSSRPRSEGRRLIPPTRDDETCGPSCTLAYEANLRNLIDAVRQQPLPGGFWYGFAWRVGVLAGAVPLRFLSRHRVYGWQLTRGAVELSVGPSGEVSGLCFRPPVTPPPSLARRDLSALVKFVAAVAAAEGRPLFARVVPDRLVSRVFQDAGFAPAGRDGWLQVLERHPESAHRSGRLFASEGWQRR